MAEDLGQEDIVGHVFGLEAVVADRSAGGPVSRDARLSRRRPRRTLEAGVRRKVICESVSAICE